MSGTPPRRWFRRGARAGKVARPAGRRLLRALVLVAALASALAGFSEWLGWRAGHTYPPLGRFVETNTGRLHYREILPEGPPRGTVVLVHGAWTGHADLLAALRPVLSGYRVLAFDRPGQGWSERRDAEMAAPDRQAAALMQALDALAPEPFVLVAHSLGAPASIALALARPNRVSGLVLLAPVTHPWLEGAQAVLAGIASSVAGPVINRVVGVPLARLLFETGAGFAFAPNPVAAGYVESAELRLLLRPQAFDANAQDIAAAQRFVARQAPRHRELRVPAVVIAGDGDLLISPKTHAAAFAREAPGARLVLLPGVGHMPHRVAAARVARSIDELTAAR